MCDFSHSEAGQGLIFTWKGDEAEPEPMMTHYFSAKASASMSSFVAFADFYRSRD